MTRTVAKIKKKQPDTEWLLLLVGIFMPEDEIFRKSFKWVKPKREQEEEGEDMLSNDDGFYDDLP